MNNSETKSNSAFTLVEILVATVVFSLFLTGLFSLYRIGTRMYMTGGWRLQRQKDAERFFNFLRERIEQSSSPVDVSADGTLTENESQFVLITPGTYSYKTGLASATALNKDPQLMMAFPVCKPAIRSNDGLIMYNMLRAKKNPDYPDLMRLEFISTPDIDSGEGQDFITGYAFDFFESNPDPDRFDGLPADFGINPVQADLKDVYSIAFSIPPIPDELVASDSLVRFDIEFQHPRHTDTKFSHSLTTSLEIPSILGGLDL